MLYGRYRTGFTFESKMQLIIETVKPSSVLFTLGHFTIDSQIAYPQTYLLLVILFVRILVKLAMLEKGI